MKYTIDNFIEKNTNSLTEQLTGLMRTSNEPFLAALFGDPTAQDVGSAGYLPSMEQALASPSSSSLALAESSASSPAKSSAAGAPPIERGRKTGASSVSLTFRNQLDALMSTLRSTTPHYIKCVKPNGFMAPGAVTRSLVVKQLRYSGVLEVVRIRREGYPIRMPFEDFHRVFERFIACTLGRPKDPKDSHSPIPLTFNPKAKTPEQCTPEESREVCEVILTKYLETDRFQLGTRKLFLRDGGVFTR